jgi:hypothetical protein
VASNQAEGWQFHSGTDTKSQRKRILRFMRRRSWWAELRYGWRAAAGKAALLAAMIGAATGWVFGPLGWMIAPVIGAAAAVLIVVPLAHGLAGVLAWWHLRHPGARVAHWCEGPNGELAFRMTAPRPARDGMPERWYGMDLYGIGGSGRRLLIWLQQRVDERGAVLIVRTTQPPLVDYYERVGFVVVRQPQLRLGHWAQFGTTVLRYPGDAAWLPVRQRQPR